MIFAVTQKAPIDFMISIKFDDPMVEFFFFSTLGVLPLSLECILSRFTLPELLASLHSTCVPYTQTRKEDSDSERVFFSSFHEIF